VLPRLFVSGNKAAMLNLIQGFRAAAQGPMNNALEIFVVFFSCSWIQTFADTKRREMAGENWVKTG
jgi:hypothetical protein